MFQKEEEVGVRSTWDWMAKEGLPDSVHRTIMIHVCVQTRDVTGYQPTIIWNGLVMEEVNQVERVPQVTFTYCAQVVDVVVD
jgi:hypothetical protein